MGHAMTAERIEYDDLDAAAQAKIAQAVKMTPRKSRMCQFGMSDMAVSSARAASLGPADL